VWWAHDPCGSCRFSGGVPAIVIDQPQGSSHLKSMRRPGRAAEKEAVAAARGVEGAVEAAGARTACSTRSWDFTFQIMNVDRVSILLLDGKSTS